MADVGRLLLLLGAAILLAGLLLLGLARLHLRLGSLPGDLSWQGRGWTIFLPLGTSLLLSCILSLLLWLLKRLR